MSVPKEVIECISLKIAVGQAEINLWEKVKAGILTNKDGQDPDERIAHWTEYRDSKAEILATLGAESIPVLAQILKVLEPIFPFVIAFLKQLFKI